jgi:hypothetical protein
MGNMSEKIIKSIWIPFFCQSEGIKEEPPTICIWECHYLGVDFMCVIMLRIGLVGRYRGITITHYRLLVWELHSRR